MKTDAFDYHLPEEMIAQHPLPERDASRLLVLNRRLRRWQDATMRSLLELLRSGDLLVFNNTKVLPARLWASREHTGGRVEVFLLPPGPETAELMDQRGDTALRRALTRCGGRLSAGETLLLPGDARATLRERHGVDGDILEFDIKESELPEYLRRYGQVPLPPYIRRQPGPSSDEDRERYQTVFASQEGAVAAPTAGLHFSSELLADLEGRGVQRTEITLHVSVGTFRPVKAEAVADHYVDPEPYEINAEAADAVTRAKADGRRVISVGTTSIRTLESCWDAEKRHLRRGTGLADLYVYPPHRFNVVDALITNFHLPKSSLLMLVAAFAAPGSEEGIEYMLRAYEHAKESGYRFYSYGDACFLE